MKYYYILFIFALVLFSCKEKEKEEQKVNTEKNIEKVKTEPVKATTKNMVYFEGGLISIGRNDGLANEQPAFEMEIEPFYLDKNLVTVVEFRKFIEATSYKTEADKFGDSGVFLFESSNWTLLKGANWEYPLGRDKEKALDNHPVTHVSWNDATAYAGWVGKRLPTEFEWEYAAKNGKNDDHKYSWGKSLVENEKYNANVWQGKTINENEPKDGFLLTSPVGYYGEHENGLTDMGGNVWQWCNNYYSPYPFNNSVAPQDPNIRTTRGGSFMFDEALEDSYTTTFRGQNSVDTSLFNMGFRCAK